MIQGVKVSIFGGETDEITPKKTDRNGSSVMCEIDKSCILHKSCSKTQNACSEESLFR